MQFWELDFYRCPVFDDTGQPLWELLVCDEAGGLLLAEPCPAAQATTHWLGAHLSALVSTLDAPLGVRIFRRATFELAAPACRALGLPVRHTRRALAVLRLRARREREVYPRERGFRALPPTPAPALPPPRPLPESLRPQQWGFSALTRRELDAVRRLPMTVLEAPALADLGDTLPGVILYAGATGHSLVRWLADHEPVSLSYVEAQLNGLVLEAGLDERWICATFQDPQMRTAGRQYVERKLAVRGAHFLAVQPDENSAQILGFWLLQTPAN